MLTGKIDRAVELIRMAAPEDGSPIEVAYSGGKDSDAILELTREAGVNYRAIYKNTTIDPPYTRTHALEMGAEMIMPKKTFFQLVEERGYPWRLRRFCCEELKEYKVLDKCIMGIRRSESTARMLRYAEPTECRFYGSKKEHVEAIYPLLDWTDQDVADFVKDRGIRCHRLYYDEDGRFHPERRLGCIGCPMNRRRVEEFQRYPQMLKAWIRAGQRYLDTHPDSLTAARYDNAVNWMARELFYESQEEWESVQTSPFRKRADWRGYMEYTFNIKL